MDTIIAGTWMMDTIIAGTWMMDTIIAGTCMMDTIIAGTCMMDTIIAGTCMMDTNIAGTCMNARSWRPFVIIENVTLVKEVYIRHWKLVLTHLNIGAFVAEGISDVLADLST